MTAAGLAMAAAALAAAAPRTEPQPRPPGREDAAPAAAATRDMVRAPVRIADAAAAGLVRPGDRVDVLAAARVVARGAPVLAVPSPAPGSQGLPATGSDGGGSGDGALIVLSVPRATAAALSGAAASSPLAVALR
ncbi:RcpC/CpaB family pilus assembly protein [Streptomyces sp. NPDC005722]